MRHVTVSFAASAVVLCLAIVAGCTQGDANATPTRSGEQLWLDELAPLQTAEGGRKHDEEDAQFRSAIKRVLDDQDRPLVESFNRAMANSQVFATEMREIARRLDIKVDEMIPDTVMQFRPIPNRQYSAKEIREILRARDRSRGR